MRLQINNYLDEVLNGTVEELTLRGGDRHPGLLKALLLQYGDDLDTLRDDAGLTAIAVDFRWWVEGFFYLYGAPNVDFGCKGIPLEAAPEALR